MKYLEGVITAMVTPFNEDGTVNCEKMRTLTRFLMDKGVDCFYPLGTTGECMRISEEERKQIAEAVINEVNHEKTVYIHVGAPTEDETIRLAKHAEQAGADGIGVVTPIYISANQRELVEYFVRVAQAVPKLPVYLYGIPQCAGNDISVEVAKQVAARCENVVGIKYSFTDVLKVDQFLLIRDETFKVVPGMDKLLLPELVMGCSGVISGISCVYPEPFVRVYQEYKKGNLLEARKWQRIATRYCDALRNGSNMSYFKMGLKLRGIDVGVMKKPQLDLTNEEFEAFEKEIIKLNSEVGEFN